MKKTKDQREAKKVMTRIDPHGDAVMDRHYWLREPEDCIRCGLGVSDILTGEIRFRRSRDIAGLGLELWTQGLGFEVRVRV